MSIRVYRYVLYSALCVLGACASAPEFEADRSDWETVFADANSCHGSACGQNKGGGQNAMNVMNSSRR